MLRPVIMIGCGGSGLKAVRYIREAVRRRLVRAGWEGEFPDAWQFIGVDTWIQEDPSIPTLPERDYISISLRHATYATLAIALDARFPPGSAGFKEMMGWRPKPSLFGSPQFSNAIPSFRATRRMAFVAEQDVVRERIVSAFSSCASGGPVLSEVSQRLGVTVPPGTTVPAPLTLVVGSMAGGTGAGIMLDVVDLLRRSHVNGAFPVMVAFAPDIFGNVVTDQMTANSAAFVSEFLSAYWDDEGTDSALIPSMVMTRTRGPHSTFMIGRKNMDGLDLGNLKNVYGAIGEALAEITTSARLMDQFYNYCWKFAPMAPNNAGGYGWQSSSTKGALSSFGSTTLSIGRDRFREYLSRLLQRSIMEHLAEGFNQAAVSYLGEGTAKAMSGQSKITELARIHRDEFMSACELMEKGNQRQVSDALISNGHLHMEFQRNLAAMMSSFPVTNQQTGAVWLQQIKVQARSVRDDSQNRAQEETSVALKDWGSELFQTVLRACTEFSARLSLPVAMNLVELAGADVLESAALMKESASNDRKNAEQTYVSGQSHLGANAKGQLGVTSAPVQNTIQDYSKAISLEWSAKVRDQLAVTLEAIATSMLNAVYAGMQQSLNRLTALVTPQDGNPAVVSLWPKNDGVVPPSFAPSPVEFYLEDHTTWPERARELLELSLGEGREHLPIDPIQAARTLLIRGGFSKGRDKTATPLIWAATVGDAAPRWSAGQVASVKVGDDHGELEERVDSWLMRPSSETERFLSLGLSDYLSQLDPRTGAAVPDHLDRLSVYRSKLQQALTNSKPLIEIDQNMYATVHPQNLVTTLNVQGFPFGEGHPAREITAGIVQGFLHTPGDVDWIFTGGEAESVLISSFLGSLVNPSVVSSFTEPLAKSLSGIVKEDLLPAWFWLWRRARVLENFIPLPDALRLSAIRGFAIARSLGYCTATVDEANKIVDHDGVHLFPKYLLTKTNTNNVLPALLEAMVLTFAEAPIKGKHAFDAYGALISYGVGGGLSDRYTLPNVLVDFLVTGTHTLEVVDPKRAAKVSSTDYHERKAAIISYLDGYINMLHEVSARPLTRTHWRENFGAVDPTDTLLLELMDDLLKGYTEVRIAVNKFDPEVLWSARS